MAPNEITRVAVELEKQIDYDRFLTDFAKRRQSSLVRELNKRLNDNVISLAGGLPNPQTFPFDNIVFNLRNGSSVTLEGVDLNNALQYMPSKGYPPLLKMLNELQQSLHNPPNWSKRDIIVTPGSQDALSKAIEMCLEEGEPIIVQHPLYSGAECALKPFQADIIAIDQDSDGMRPDLIRKALQKRMQPYEGFTRKRGIPKLMYINTTGSNPTGTNMSTERKREIYQIACEYNLLILDDDPYYFLHFMEEYPESFLSMDVEGRVLRMDSFSKIISPGIRVAWATGPEPLIRRMELHTQATTLHASSLSQVMIYKVISNWGISGLMKRFTEIQAFYKERRDVMNSACQKYLSDVAEWDIPTAGMYLWIRVTVLDDVRNLVLKECQQRGVLFMTGHAYFIDSNAKCQYLRSCFSPPALADIEVGIKRLREAIDTELSKRKI